MVMVMGRPALLPDGIPVFPITSVNLFQWRVMAVVYFGTSLCHHGVSLKTPRHGMVFVVTIRPSHTLWKPGRGLNGTALPPSTA